MKRLAKLIFFGNYFYGICAVLLSIEATLQQRYPLNDILFYLMVFLSTVIYYNIAYIGESNITTNQRSAWYVQNRVIIRRVQNFLIAGFASCAVFFVIYQWENIFKANALQWILMLIFPLVALLYYGFNHESIKKLKLRDIGWLKPFIIGFSWAGLVTVYPIIYYCIVNGQALQPTLIGLLLFIKNFMFISLLCVLFDIKDYATDANHRLKTFVVEVGLRKTIFYIIIPLTIVGLGSFLTYGGTHDFSAMKILLNTIPFLLLITVAYSLHRRRSIFYYLVIIDGLMLVKAVCGIIAMTYF